MKEEVKEEESLAESDAPVAEVRFNTLSGFDHSY